MSASNKIAMALQEEVFRYAKRNMALVNVYIKDPVVTRIKRDQKITVIGFVANTGGLLGLCMGFSLISAFEIIFHCLISIRKVYLLLYGYCTRGFDNIWKCNQKNSKKCRMIFRARLENKGQMKCNYFLSFPNPIYTHFRQ